MMSIIEEVEDFIQRFLIILL